ncbi:GspE/PulE family protein [Aureicoccus marinus]|uniref:General secretion pathway protein GspE n=1 Tax=Aureicoccus marinus TaxID=754435 RepID=A0A2S7T5V9_9FLAO|nr:GspE/PulE family protein [Aureicoccus marinus]PQJ15309.1 general secretion pathway protein GspE [Aureicoccus marinus]
MDSTSLPLFKTEALQRITAAQAHQYRIVPMSYEEGLLRLLTDQHIDEVLSNELGILISDSISLESCSTEDLQKYLSTYYRLDQSRKVESLSVRQDFLESVLSQAQSMGSSDIHFESFEDSCRIRFRLDGKLVEQYKVEKAEYPSLINKIKIRSGLDIAEKRLPQDGRLSLTLSGTSIDIRVSVLPTLYGEKAVLRILSQDISGFELERLGMQEEELLLYRQAIQKPNGIVLISGPTGSGKTTTLYATLKILNNHQTNILTVEDPIEYTLEGVNQVQLRENIGLDFGKTLKTFLRQDPDIIMVGEIRDAATANMAIRAALTGHLVLSTIHTNSAWATVSRLIDMGIPPFLIASTLNLSVAQRLVRKLCTHCSTTETVDKLEPYVQTHLPKDLREHGVAQGCEHCHYTGYKGRVGLYEVLPINEDLVEDIKQNATEVRDYFTSQKLLTLKDNALERVRNKETSIAEVLPLII